MNYKQKYLQFFDHGEQDCIMSETGAGVAVDIHHISRRSSKGTRNQQKHSLANLIALTREEHDEAHKNAEESGWQLIHDNYMIKFLAENSDKWNELDEYSKQYYLNK